MCSSRSSSSNTPNSIQRIRYEQKVKGNYIYEWSDENEKFFGSYERAERLMKLLDEKVARLGELDSGSFGVTRLVSAKLQGLHLELTLHSHGMKQEPAVLVLSPAFAKTLRDAQDARRYAMIDEILERGLDE